MTTQTARKAHVQVPDSTIRNIMRRNLADGVPLDVLCNSYDITPSTYHRRAGLLAKQSGVTMRGVRRLLAA